MVQLLLRHFVPHYLNWSWDPISSHTTLPACFWVPVLSPRTTIASPWPFTLAHSIQHTTPSLVRVSQLPHLNVRAISEFRQSSHCTTSSKRMSWPGCLLKVWTAAPRFLPGLHCSCFRGLQLTKNSRHTHLCYLILLCFHICLHYMGGIRFDDGTHQSCKHL